MSFAVNFPLFSIIVSFVGVVLCSLFPAKKGRYVAYFCELFSFASGLVVLLYCIVNGPVIYQMGHLSHSESGEPLYWFNNVIRLGVSEALLASLFPLVMLFCLLGGQKKLQEDISEEKEKYYYVLANLALVALTALVYADDIFTGYVFLEISTLASIGLIAIKDKGRTTVAAIRYMIFNLVGSGLYLIGIVLLYDMTGYFMLEKIQVALTELAATGKSLPVVTCSVALITVGLGIKSGLFPFYFWMADTYGESTTSSAGIISGLISKGYIVLLIKYVVRAYGFSHTYIINGERVVLGVIEQTGILDIMFAFGVCGMIFGSVSALCEKRINKMIAYSSAAQIGYIFLALGLGEAGIAPAMFQVIAHTVTKPLLFVSARGLIDVSDHRPQFRYLRGSATRNVLAGAGFFVGSMSMVGFPATVGFIVKLLYIRMALGEGISLVRLVVTISALVISTLLNTAYLLHTVITIYSPQTEMLPLTDKHKNRRSFIVSVCALSAFNIVLGVVPQIASLVSTGADMLGFIS